MKSGHQHLAYEPIVEIYANEEDPAPEVRSQCRELFMQSVSGKDVLEIGCGPGHDAAKLRDAGYTVTAIDLCKGFVTYAQSKYPRIDFKCMDLQEPTFEPETFDGVFGAASLCHIQQENILLVLSKYYEILRPGGCMFLFLSDSKKVDGYTVEDWGGVQGNLVEMVCHKRDTIKTEFEEAGFGEVYITPLTSPFYDELPRLKKLGIRLYAIAAHKTV